MKRVALAVLAAASFVATAAGQPATAAADTARIVLDGAAKPGSPTSATIVVTAVDGTTRTLGPYRFRHAPTELTASPDGRFLAIRPGSAERSQRITVVPTDGTGPFALRIETRGLVVTSRSEFSWSADGSELVVGHAQNRRAIRGHGIPRSVALRCPVAARVCQRIPGSEGLAAAVPGGVVTSTPLDDVVPFDLALARDGLTATIDARPSRQSRLERELLRDLRRRRVSRTTIVGAEARTISRTTSTLAAGIAPASSIVAGPSGALVTHTRYRMLITRRGTTLRLRARTGPRRWERIRADGTRRVGPVRFLRIPKSDGTLDRGGRRLLAQRAPVVPQVPVASGGWLATVGTPDRGGRPGPDALALATVDEYGAAGFVRAGGRIASATALVRSVLHRVPTRGLSWLRVVGHEAATNAAIIALNWIEGSAETALFSDDGPPRESEADRPTSHRATVRVPLDGRTSTSVVSREQEHAAW